MTPAAGVGLKAEHFAEALAAPAADLWFEVHPENYMVEGGPRLAMLEMVRRDRPLSLHGVGMSLCSGRDPDREHLAALKRLVDRFEPALVSEHLAWSRLDGRCFPDLLPVPRTNEALRRLARNIGCVQDALGREILIENPTHYLALSDHEWSETSFLAELARRTGCKLLIDSHDAPVSEYVWQLYEGFVEHTGPVPTLIERDGNVPPFAELIAERNRANGILRGSVALAA